MTTENLKAVLTEDELGFISEFTVIGGVFTKIISRLANEIVGLRDKTSKNDNLYGEMFLKLRSVLDALHGAGEYALFQNAVDYRDWAQSRIKELEDALHEVKEREVREIERTIVAEAKLKAWEDGPTITVQEGSFFAEQWVAEPGVYYLKPKEADDVQGN